MSTVVSSMKLSGKQMKAMLEEIEERAGALEMKATVTTCEDKLKKVQKALEALEREDAPGEVFNIVGHSLVAQWYFQLKKENEALRYRQ